MTRPARRTAAALVTVLGLAVATAPTATAAPSYPGDPELAWTLTCENRTVAITSSAGPRGPHDPLYVPVFSDEGGVYVMVSEGLATATFTDPDGTVVFEMQVEGRLTGQGGPAARKGGVNAQDCVAVADSTDVWSTDGSHLRIVIPMRLVVAGRR